MPNNQDRAGWARKALSTYSLATRHAELKAIGDDELEEVVSDFLGDLMHFVDRIDPATDFDSLLERGRGHYTEEVEEASHVFCSHCGHRIEYISDDLDNGPQWWHIDSGRTLCGTTAAPA